MLLLGEDRPQTGAAHEHGGSVLAVGMETAEDRLILHISGELDIATHTELSRLSGEVYQRVRVGGLLVFDLRGLTFCDVAGLQTIQQLCGIAHQKRCGTVIEQAPRVVRLIADVLEVADLNIVSMQEGVSGHSSQPDT